MSAAVAAVASSPLQAEVKCLSQMAENCHPSPEKDLGQLEPPKTSMTMMAWGEGAAVSAAVVSASLRE